MDYLSQDIFSQETSWTVLQSLASVHAPSQTVAYTRARVLEQLFDVCGAERMQFDRNYRQTGNAVAFLGERTDAPQILLLAHADELSYLLAPDQFGAHPPVTWPLEAFGSDRALDTHEATALRWLPDQCQLTCVAEGEIRRVGNDDEIRTPVFVARSGSLLRGDRVVYHRPLKLGSDGLVHGAGLDNTVGLAACVLAATALSRSYMPVSVAFAFTDEEEGPSVDNVGFSRGARRLFRRLDPPIVCLNIDGHDSSFASPIGTGAVFAESSSHCRGAVTPPHLYAIMKQVAEQVVSDEIHLIENVSYVSRSDDVSAFEASPNVVLLGYPISDPHFNRAVPSVALSDLVNLARAIVSVVRFLSESVQYGCAQAQPLGTARFSTNGH